MENTLEQKAMVGKRAAEHGVVAAVRYYIRDFPNLKDNTVRDWRNVYRLELKKRVRNESECDINITELPQKKRGEGRPLILGAIAMACALKVSCEMQIVICLLLMVVTF